MLDLSRRMASEAADMHFVDNGFFTAYAKRDVASPVITVIHDTAAHGGMAIVARLAACFAAPIKLADRPCPRVDQVLFVVEAKAVFTGQIGAINAPVIPCARRQPDYINMPVIKSAVDVLLQGYY